MNYLKARLLTYYNSIKIQYYKLLISLCKDCADEDKKEVKQKNISSKANVINEEIMGQYSTVKQMLDDLDNVFKDTAKMKPKTSAGNIQRLIKKFGVFMPDLANDPEDWLNPNELDGFKAYGFPFYLGVYLNNKQYGKPDSVNSFICSERVDRLPLRKAKQGFTYYESTIVANFDGRTYEMAFHVEINKATGDVYPVKMCHKKRIRINKYDGYTAEDWDYPEEFKEMQNGSADKDLPMDAFLKRMFIIAFNFTMKREYSVNINVRKGKQRVTIAVPTNNWKKFFSERIKVKTPNGNTKPIFHCVMSHHRHLKHMVSNVKTHYRGVRQFLWGKYSVSISIPGKHGISQSINLEGHLFNKGEPTKGYMKKTDFDKTLNNMIDGVNAV